MFLVQVGWAVGPTLHFDIPAQDLHSALNRYLVLTGIQSLLISDHNDPSVKDAKSVRTHTVLGDYDSAEGLRRMLEGTGLTFQFRGDKAVTILPGASSVSKAKTRDDPQKATAMAMADEGSGEKIPEVTVTGSLIRGLKDIVSPLVIIDRNDKQRAAYATVEDVLRTLPYNFGGGPSEDFSTSANFSRGSSLNLRGLGAEATLVLINGRRQPASGIDGDFVDVSAIPWSFVDRIEVLPDGSSALYGSDAIAGVVNIILRDDLKAGETQARLGSALGGADQALVAQLFGHRWSTGKLLLAYQYSDQTALPLAARAYAASGDKRPFGGSDLRIFSSNPGNILDPFTQHPVFAIPRDQDGKSLTPNQLLSGVVNLQSEEEGYDLLPNRRSHNAYLTTSQQLGERFELYAEGRFTDRRTNADERAWNQILVVPKSNPFFVDPFGDSSFVLVAYNFIKDLGVIHDVSTTDTYAATLGVKADIGSRWQATLSGYETTERMHWTGYNLPDPVALSVALADPNRATAFNPFGSGSNTNPATLESIRLVQHEEPASTIKTAGLILDGPLGDFPTGTPKLALGFDKRWETFSRKETFNSEVLTAHFGRSNFATFAELSLPASRNLELSLAARYETYSDFGKTFNPKFGARWSLSDSLRFRASWGSSFRAPKLVDVYDHTQDYALITPLADPRSPEGHSIVLMEGGTNPALHEERARTWTIGTDLAPAALAGFTLSSTYYDIDYKDRTWKPLQLPETFLSDSQWAPLVNRNPTASQIEAICSSPSFYGSPSECTANPPTVILDLRLRNLSTTVVRGLDVELQQKLQTKYGTLNIALKGSRIFSFEQAIIQSAPVTDLAGIVGNPSAFRVHCATNWYRHGADQPGFGFGLSADYRSGSKDDQGPSVTHDGSEITFGLQVNYRTEKIDPWWGNLEFSLNAVNIFNQDPPFVNRVWGYDTTNDKPYGRVVSLGILKSW